MLGKVENMILIVAILIGIATYIFWPICPKGTFYYGNAIFICLLSAYIHQQKDNALTFILFWLSVGNLMDELFFTNTKLHIAEIVYAVCVFIIAYLRYVRQRR